jgi:hypothetical protein
MKNSVRLFGIIFIVCAVAYATDARADDPPAPTPAADTTATAPADAVTPAPAAGAAEPTKKAEPTPVPPAAKKEVATPVANKVVPPKPAQPKVDLKDNKSVIEAAVNALKGGHWGLLLAILCMYLTRIVSAFSGKINKLVPAKYLPWVSVIAGCLTNMGHTYLTMPAATWPQIASGGILAGLAGAGLYSAGGKKLPGMGTQ